MRALWDYNWPGNIRELQNLIHRYVAVGDLDLERDLDRSGQPKDAAPSPSDEAFDAVPLKECMQRYEKKLINKMLDRHKWQKTKVARLLGINRKTLFEKIRKYNLSPFGEQKSFFG